MDIPKILVINSQNRVDYQNTTPSNFRFDIGYSIKIKECVQVKLIAATIPNTFYNITSLNNTFKINSTTFNIPPGAYNLNNLMAEIANLVSVSFPNMSIAYDTVTSAVTFQNNVNFTLDLTVGNLYKSISFNPIVYSGANNYTGKYAPVVDPGLYFYICMDWGGHVVRGSATNTGSFLVQNNANIGNYIFFNSNSNWYTPLDLKGQLNRVLSITLRDINGNILEGASDWVMILGFM